MKDYIERTVLRLKKRYGKDELVAHLTKKLKDAEMEIGFLKSELAEATDNIEELARQMFDTKFKQGLGDKYAARVRDVKQQNKALRKKNAALIKENNDLKYTYIIKPNIKNQ